MLKYLRSGILYTALGKYSNVVIQLIVNAVLSRLLTPHDYGVVAIVQVFLIFFTTLVDAGLGPAVIQNKTLTDQDNTVLFRYSVLFSMGLSALFIMISPLIAIFYGNSIYIPLAATMSLTLFFQGINMIPNALMDKAKRFREVNIRLVVSNICGGIAGVVTAFVGWGAYALVISTTVPAIMAFVLNLILLRIRPSSHFDRKSLSKVWKFAKSQFGFNFINYFSRNIDKILVGKMMGAEALGNYSKSYQLLMMPNQVLLGVLNPVLLPVLSDYQDDVTMVRKTYLSIVHILALIGLPLSVFLSFESRDIIYILFGNQWDNAVFPFAILALTVWIQMTLSSTGAIFQTLGQTRQLLWNGCISAGLMVTSIVIGCLFGNINAMSISLSIGFFLNFIAIYWMMMKYTLHSDFKTLLTQFVKPCCGGIILATILLGLHAFPVQFNHFTSLLINTGVMVVVVIASYSILGEWKYIRSIFSRNQTSMI